MTPIDKLTPDERRVIAEAARRILNEDVFIRATETVRLATLEQLVKADPYDPNAITTLQATVKAIDDIAQKLKDFTALAPREAKKIL